MRKTARYLFVFLSALSLCISSVPVRAAEEMIAPDVPILDARLPISQTVQEVAVPIPAEVAHAEIHSSIVTQTELVQSSPIAVQSVVAPVAPVLTVDESPVVPVSDLLITGFGVSGSRQLTFLQLTNTDDKPFLLTGVTIELLYATQDIEAPCIVDLAGYLLPKEHLLLAPDGTTSITHPHQGVIRHFTCESLPGYVLENIMLYQYGVPGNKPMEDIRISYFSMPAQVSYVWMRKGVTASSRTGEAKDFILFNSATHRLYGSDIYQPPETNALEIIEILINPQNCLPGDVRTICYSYVKVYNPSEHSVDLAQYRLRGGEIDKSDTSSNTSTLHGVVAARSFAVIARDTANERLAINTTAGTMWFQDTYGLKNYPSTVTPYAGASNAGNKGKSWAFDAAKQVWSWGQPSPYTLTNEFADEPPVLVMVTQGLKPCSANQYRSEETNRCRTLSVASAQTPCREGQYRNEATNRCRNIALGGGTLTPCKETQYRSEETNRCRNLVTAASTLVPCKDNQYRSEMTNRCRTLASATVPAAAFAVEPVSDTSTAFVGWWILGGLGIVAAAYGVWEWRREVMNGLRRMVAFFTVSK